VVSEYADRKMTEGLDAYTAYSMAAKRMFWPVTASVATTLAAFLPLMLWPGVSGKFMGYLPVTVFTVLMGSLLYALIIAPTLGALFGKAGNRDEKSTLILRELEQGDPTRLKNITGFYARVLEKAAKFAPLTLALTIAFLLLTFVGYRTLGNGVVFFNEADPQYARVMIKARGNLSATDANALLLEVEREVLKIPGIEELNSSTTTAGNASFRNNTPPDTIGRMFLAMYPESDRELSGKEILEEIRNRTAHLAGIEVEVRQLQNGPPTGKDIQIQFQSRKRDLLEPAIQRVREYLENSVADLRDIEDTRALPGIEWKLEVDRAQAALFGADVSQVGLAVQFVTNGVLVSKYRPDGAEDEVDIRVRFPIHERGIGALDNLNITTRSGLVPLSNFVKRTPHQKIDSLLRIDSMPIGRIQASVAPTVLLDTKVNEIQRWIDSQTFDPRLKIIFRGANEEQEQTFAFIGNALVLALLLMFALLVTQFNSLYQSSLILFAVLMSTAGVLLGLIITQNPFSAILTGTGVVALAGIVVNNNIVLIDTYNHLKVEHPELDYIALIVRTGAQRLRPVMLTTVTTVFGLLPMSMNWSIDFVNRSMVHGSQVSSTWVPLAQSIVWGLSVATMLTLVATPAMLAIPHQIKALFQRSSDKAPKHIESVNSLPEPSVEK
ncbi:MAG: efflux RND transporter permease subunit, partial [Pseudomonadales bacterium]|nr:efflux RND transporter permease subunit [Pseudomonadales bacterium]